MAARNPQTMAKRAREQVARERRERKQASKAEAAAARVAAKVAAAGDPGSADAPIPSAVPARSPHSS